MKRLLFILMFVSVLAGTSQAEIIKFEAEAEFYSIAGNNWQTVDDPAASGGAYITAIVNGDGGDPVNYDNIPANERHYEIPLSAGTYNVYIHAYIGPDNNGYNDDSIYVPDNAFGSDAAMIDWNNTTDDALDGESMAQNYGWARLEASYSDTARVYTLASAGTAVWKMSTREDGFRIDTIAFVTEGQTVTGTELDEAPFIEPPIRGAAMDPVPAHKDTTVDSDTTTAVSWSAPLTQSEQDGDPNLVSVGQFDITYYILDNDQVTDDDPNLADKGTTYGNVTSPYSISISYDQTMFWRIDTHVVWDSDEVTGVVNDTVEGYEWFFTTLPEDKVPFITVSNVLTSLDLLPASLTGTVDDYGEDDIASVAWEVIGTNAVPAAMQMYIRPSAAALENLAEITVDPNLLIDWIGTDTREVGNPMVLTLKDLPADTYSWTSYHHDADDNPVMGLFDATVIDATGSTVIADNQITDSNEVPVPFTTSFTANGTDDVVLVFEQHPYAGQGYNDAWFIMNGFELTADTAGGTPLYIDFGRTAEESAPMNGYEVYEATNENAASFIEQSYSAFGTTVSILPTWGGYAKAINTTTDPLSPTATFTTDWPGEYTVQLSATDDPGGQTGSDTMIVTVAEDACAAAQLSTWDGFSIADFNEDCVVNLEDFAGLASEWLDDRSLTGQLLE